MSISEETFELYSATANVNSETGFNILKCARPDLVEIEDSRVVNAYSYGHATPTMKIKFTITWDLEQTFNKELFYSNTVYSTYVLFKFSSLGNRSVYTLKCVSVDWDANHIRMVLENIPINIKLISVVEDYRRKLSYSTFMEKKSMITLYSNKMPYIIDVYYNEPNTVVKWTDGTETVVACTTDDTFSKEIGLSVAIAKKYLSMLGYTYPRAALKHIVENSHDQTAKTKARKEYKANKKNQREDA